MPYSAHCVWTHEIDSKEPGVGDEGDMFLLLNGDCMEVGMMENPKTGKVEMYKEYWAGRDVELGSESGEVKKRPCIVAKTALLDRFQGMLRDGSGVVIRVGDYCLGIVQHGGEEGVFVERWVRMPVPRNPALPGSLEGKESSAGEWLKDWRSNTSEGEEGDVLMPCMWICGGDRKLGDEIVLKGVTWRVVEVVL